MPNAPAITITPDYRDAAGNWHVRWQMVIDGRAVSGEAVCDPSLGRTIISEDAPPLPREVQVSLKRAVAAECAERVRVSAVAGNTPDETSP